MRLWTVEVFCLIVATVNAFLVPTPFMTKNNARLAAKVSSLDEVIQKYADLPLLMDFYAKWCGPCQMLQPVLGEVAKETKGKLRVAKIDTEKYPQVGNQMNISAFPTLVLFKNGKEVRRIMGFQTRDQIIQQIQPYL